MSEQYILSLDPGKSSGIALGRFSDTEPYSLVDGWQFDGGLVGLLDWLVSKTFDYYTYEYDPQFTILPEESHGETVITVCEKYVPLQGKGFAQTLDSTEPLRCEGALVALGVMPDYPNPTWRRANEMYFLGGKDKAEKRKRLKRFLKDTGNYRYGKDLGAPDNEDFVSAVAHGISYVMKTLAHKPTFEQVSEWGVSQ